MPATNLRPVVARFLLLAGAAILAAAPPVRAQSLHLPRDTEHAVLLEMLRPSVESVDGEILSAAYLLSCRTSVSDGIALVGELPFARFAGTVTYYNGYPFYGFYVGEISENAFGNPYLGLETRGASTPVFFEFGFRPPLAPKTEWSALSHGQRADRLRRNAFYSDVVSIQAAVNVREETVHHMNYRLRFSPILTHDASDFSNGSDLWANYSFEIGYAGRGARIGAGISGGALVTASGNVGARASSQFDLRGDFLGGAIRPGLLVRIPLGPTASSVPVVLGVTLAWVD